MCLMHTFLCVKTKSIERERDEKKKVSKMGFLSGEYELGGAPGTPRIGMYCIKASL